MAGGIAGSIAALWRFPVKSMRGERLDCAEITGRGLVGDRAYALIDVETGKVASAKSVRLFPDLLSCEAAFVEPPEPGCEVPPVRITLPNGTSVASGSSQTDGVLSAFFRRHVVLARSAPVDFTIEQYHPDIENLDPEGHRNIHLEQKLGSAFFAQAGLDSPVPAGSFFDLFPLTVLTTSSLGKLNKLQPESRFDQRRFRMNLIVETNEAGFVENGWIGRELAIGSVARVRVTLPDPRCVMTTLGQEDLPNDPKVLRTLVRHNRVEVGSAGQFPCAGAYAVVVRSGKICRGDAVRLE
jgi:uncharacterized protein YcbX